MPLTLVPPIKSTRIRRYALWGTVVLIVVAGILYSLRPQPVLVDVAIAEVGAMRVSVDDDGVTRIRERYVVSTPLTGRLQRITLEVGDEVHAEETVLARLEATDPALLDPRAVAQAKARVRAAERRLDSAKAGLTKAEATLNFAETEMGRARQLLRNNALSESEFAVRELEFRQATEEARSAGFLVDIAQHELELERAALLLTDPEASDDSMELEITAPIDGRVLRVIQESAAVVNAGEELMEIGDPNDLEIVSDVLSRDAVRIERADPVELRHWGGERPLRGRVRLVEPSGFTKFSALGVEEQRVNVIMDFVDATDARESLGDNFRVECQIIVWEADQVLRIPTSALFRVEDSWTVFVVRDETAVETKIEIGHDNGRVAEILGGLAEGDRVIVHPSDRISDGTRIAVR